MALYKFRIIIIIIIIIIIVIIIIRTGNTVSAIVFWPLSNETLTATSFLLICLAIVDNVMLFCYYVLVGVSKICEFNNTCHYYRRVRYSLIGAILAGARVTKNLKIFRRFSLVRP